MTQWLFIFVTVSGFVLAGSIVLGIAAMILTTALVQCRRVWRGEAGTTQSGRSERGGINAPPSHPKPPARPGVTPPRTVLLRDDVRAASEE